MFFSDSNTEEETESPCYTIYIATTPGQFTVGNYTELSSGSKRYTSMFRQSILILTCCVSGIAGKYEFGQRK